MTNTEKIELVFEAAKFLAGLWRRFGYPVTFDRVLTIDGVDVRVIAEDVRLAKRRGVADLENQQSEQSIHD